jgi:hypothetical protein
LLQNAAILRNGAETGLPLVSSVKYAAQSPEKLRKKPSLKLQISCSTTLPRFPLRFARQAFRTNSDTRTA